MKDRQPFPDLFVSQPVVFVWVCLPAVRNFCKTSCHLAITEKISALPLIVADPLISGSVLSSLLYDLGAFKSP